MSSFNPMRRKLYEKILNEFFNGSDKKLMDVEESKDSGFISAEIELSGEIPSDEEPCEQERSSKNFSSHNIDNNSSSMRCDSGIALVSGQLSDLRLGSDGKKLNNLSGTTSSDEWKSSSQKQEQTYLSDPLEEVSKSPSWEYYFHQDEDGDTPLHIGIIHGFTEAVHSLVRLAPYPQLLDVRNDTCQSPLHLAVLTGQSVIVRLLVVAGAKQSVRDRYGETALHLACQKGDLYCVRALTAPINVDEVKRLALQYKNVIHEPINYEQWNYEGETCIHVAAMQGHTEILRHLVWLKADVNAREGKAGYTALHYAVARKDKTMLEYLLNECEDLNLETECYSRRTAYEITRDPEVRSMLVKKDVVLC
ncbi:NF-kappa-B inhibitor cactus isoform X2 [Chrysoperla carnea]|uniref:NF-kappa-B inhibitor cactus isoform X2 n=1 Tax=Chrysoperla carnea TaxID=189513 RepID=UPI001D094225|nr:NF-kappa-B inhibitor cactus isoform X2 [Chrysoperla carnea]